MPQRTLVYQRRGCQAHPQRLAPGLQHRTTSQLTEKPHPGAVCHAAPEHRSFTETALLMSGPEPGGRSIHLVVAYLLIEPTNHRARTICRSFSRTAVSHADRDLASLGVSIAALMSRQLSGHSPDSIQSCWVHPSCATCDVGSPYRGLGCDRIASTIWITSVRAPSPEGIVRSLSSMHDLVATVRMAKLRFAFMDGATNVLIEKLNEPCPNSRAHWCILKICYRPHSPCHL